MKNKDMFKPSILYMSNEEAIDLLNKPNTIYPESKGKTMVNEANNISILLGRALQILVNETANKEKQLESLAKRIDLSADFKEFLIDKIQRENKEIMSLCCAIDSISPSCTAQQQEEFTDKQRRAITLILENERVCNNVADLHDRLNHKNGDSV